MTFPTTTKSFRATAFASVAVGALLAAGNVSAAPIMGSFDSFGAFDTTTDLEEPGRIVADNSTTELRNGTQDFTGIPTDGGTLVMTIDPVAGAVLPIDEFLTIVGNGYDLTFILEQMSDAMFETDGDEQTGFYNVSFNGSGSVSGSNQGTNVDGNFTVALTGQQSRADNEGSWSASFDVVPTADVAEPASAMLLFGGIGALAVAARRRRTATN